MYQAALEVDLSYSYLIVQWNSNSYSKKEWKKKKKINKKTKFCSHAYWNLVEQSKNRNKLEWAGIQAEAEQGGDSYFVN